MQIGPVASKLNHLQSEFFYVNVSDNQGFMFLSWSSNNTIIDTDDTSAMRTFYKLYE